MNTLGDMAKRLNRPAVVIADLVVLCHTEEARTTLQTVTELLAPPIRLQLNEPKTAIVPSAAGFHFLGQGHGGAVEVADVAEAAERRMLYVRDPPQPKKSLDFTGGDEDRVAGWLGARTR